MSRVLYPELARIAAALSSSTRLRALELLLQRERTVEALATLLGQSEANTAAHMKALRRANVVSAERQGKYVLLRANKPLALRLYLSLLEAGAELSPELRLLDREMMTTASGVTLAELADLLGSRQVLLVDLRPEEEFQAGHIPGARSLPFQRLKDQSTELLTSSRILAYARGMFCPNAHQGVLELRDAGLKAERLRFGVPEWQASGRVLDTGGA